MRIALFFLAVLAPAYAMAEDLPSPWKGGINAGGLIAAGNTRVISMDAGLVIGYEEGVWRHDGRAEWYLLVSEDDESAWATASGSSRLLVTKRLYAFGALRYDENPDTGYDYRASGSIGMGLYLWRAPRFTMLIEAGPGLRENKLTDEDGVNEVVGRGYFEYVWHISRTATFMQNLLVISGEEGTYTETVNEMASMLAGRLGMKATFTLIGDDTPASDANEVDFRLTTGLTYRFGGDASTGEAEF